MNEAIHKQIKEDLEDKEKTKFKQLDLLNTLAVFRCWKSFENAAHFKYENVLCISGH